MNAFRKHSTSPVALPFAAIVVAMLPAVLDQTILATALPTVAADLGRLTDLSWVVTAYVVAAAATPPLSGNLGARRDQRSHAHLHLGGRTLPLGLDPGARARGGHRASRRRPRDAGAAGGRAASALRHAAQADRGRSERLALPGHGIALRRHGLRAA